MCYHGFCCGDQEGGCEAIVEFYTAAFVEGGGYAGPAPGSAHPDTGSLPGPRPMTPRITVPRQLADDVAATCQEAVRWFHEPGHVFLGDPTVRTVPDEEVRERIAGYQSELDAEWRRVVRIPANDVRAPAPTGPDVLKYELSEMPFARQRALVERWERSWTDWLTAHPGWMVTDGGFIPPAE